MILKTGNAFAWWQGFLAAYGSLATATIFAEVFPPRVAGFLLALSAALNAGTAVYISTIKRVEETPNRYRVAGGGETYRVVD